MTEGCLNAMFSPEVGPFLFSRRLYPSMLFSLPCVTRRFVVLIAVFCWPTIVLAGGGPENVFLVVNPQSASSLCIANHYVQLRQIPPSNLFHLPWNVKAQTTDIDTFRQKILVPILKEIQNRRLSDQIDYVIYSSDFPWGIVLKQDINKFVEAMKPPKTAPRENGDDASPLKKPAVEPKWPKQLTGTGSLNGLTYLWQPVAAAHPAYCQLQSNHYMHPAGSSRGVPPSAGFRGDRFYGSRGEVVVGHGRRYFLSTMLGVTSGRGNSIAEVIDYLQRSAKADGTHPKGTIYFVQNKNIRSKVRDKLFPTAISELKKLGVAAEILEGTVPLRKNDVQGVVMGTASFSWKTSGSTILPGAICEHFTSFAGVMRQKAGQTPLAEFLRYGAAGASGTVTEPYAIAEKFPSSMIQVHYARGCSLAEAFYQSVHGPYQLLIVGDPLCRPWADIPQVAAEGIEPGEVLHGDVHLKPTATFADGAATDHFELFVDGQRVTRCNPHGTLSLNTKRLADGYHQLRVVAVGPPPIESQGRKILSVKVSNRGRKIKASLKTKEPLRADQPVTIVARSRGSIGIVAIHGSRVVGRVAGEGGPIVIPPKVLGAGPVRLRIAGLGRAGPASNVMAEPLEFTLE